MLLISPIRWSTCAVWIFLADLGRLGEPLVLEQLAEQLAVAEDRVERGPQLVAHVRHEVALGLAGALRGPSRPLVRRGRAHARVDPTRLRDQRREGRGDLGLVRLRGRSDALAEQHGAPDVLAIDDHREQEGPQEARVPGPGPPLAAPRRMVEGEPARLDEAAQHLGPPGRRKRRERLAERRQVVAPRHVVHPVLAADHGDPAGHLQPLAQRPQEQVQRLLDRQRRVRGAGDRRDHRQRPTLGLELDGAGLVRELEAAQPLLVLARAAPHVAELVRTLAGQVPGRAELPRRAAQALEQRVLSRGDEAIAGRAALDDLDEVVVRDRVGAVERAALTPIVHWDGSRSGRP
jgi:hypothetical protein